MAETIEVINTPIIIELGGRVGPGGAQGPVGPMGPSNPANNVDGGAADSVYGGTVVIDGGDSA